MTIATEARFAQARVSALLSAQSVAIIGISAKRPDGWGRAILDTLRAGRFAGDVWAINPGAEVPGVPTYRSIRELPQPPDLLAICVPPSRVADALTEAAASGVRGAVVFTSGFAERSEDGLALQDELLQAAGDMPFIGPNCVGIANFREGLCLTAIRELARFAHTDGDVAIVTQSGAMGAVILERLAAANVGVSHFVSSGNAAVLGAPALAESLLHDDAVRVVVGYIESASESASWARLGRLARSKGKHIVLLVVGKTSAARRAAVSHTAAATGDAELFSGVVRAAGIILAIDEEDVAELVIAVRRGHTLPRSPRVAIVTNSGGAGTVLLDRLPDINASPSSLTADTETRLRELEVLEASVTNPIDVGGNWERALPALPQVLDLLAEDDGVDAIVTYFPFGALQIERLRAIPDHAALLGVPLVHVWAAPPARATHELESADIVVSSLAAAVRRLDAMRRAGTASIPQEPEVFADQIDVSAFDATVPETYAATILRGFGADMVESQTVRSAEDIERVVSALDGSGPWVVKGQSEQIPHRASAGLVRLNVSTAQLPTVMLDVLELLEMQATSDDRRAVVVQPQLSHSAVLSVGGLRDSDHGPLIVVGPGGALAESRDARRQSLGLPVSAAALAAFAEEMSARFAVESRSLEELVRAIARCLLADDSIRAVEVNPAVLTAAGRLVGVDALIDLAEPQAPHADSFPA